MSTPVVRGSRPRPGSALRACLLAVLGAGTVSCAGRGAVGDGATVSASLPGSAASAPFEAACPPADGVGSMAPAVGIYAITFMVNGSEQVIRDAQPLLAEPGDQVSISSADVCAVAAVDRRGEVCVEVAPVRAGGSLIRSAAWGSHQRPVTSGFMTLSGPSITWTIQEDWGGFEAVANHWVAGVTEDPGCADRRCERDDYMTVPLP